MVNHEQRIEEARQEYRDAAEALRQPFKHETALTEARRSVERINQQMTGHDQPEPALDSGLSAMQKMRRAAFPTPPGPARAAASPHSIRGTAEDVLPRRGQGRRN